MWSEAACGAMLLFPSWGRFLVLKSSADICPCHSRRTELTANREGASKVASKGGQEGAWPRSSEPDCTEMTGRARGGEQISRDERIRKSWLK